MERNLKSGQKNLKNQATGFFPIFRSFSIFLKFNEIFYFKIHLSFPLRLLLVTQEDMDGAFVQPIKVHGHARIMKVAGKQHEHFLDQLIVKKVFES